LRETNFREYNFQVKNNTGKPVILCTRIDRDNNTVYHVLKLCRSLFCDAGTRCH